MVRHNKPCIKMHSTYYFKPGETLENMKIRDKSRALVVPKSTFDRLVDYTNEDDKLATAADEKAAKDAELRKATYEMSKSWVNTVANIKKRHRDQLLNRKKRDNESRAQFAKELAAKNAEERAKIVDEARKLIFWQKPQCRLINGALLTAECYRELHAQLAIEKMIKDMDRKRETEYASLMKMKAEYMLKKAKMEEVERIKRNRAYGQQLRNQIDMINNYEKRMNREELQAEREALRGIARELRMIEECEAQEKAKRKEETRKFFTEDLEAKRHHAIEIQRYEEFENRALDVFAKSKDRIKAISKSKMNVVKSEKQRRSEMIAKQCAAARYSRQFEEEKSLSKALKEKEASEQEKDEAKKKYEEKLRTELEKYNKEVAAANERRANEEKNLKNWELLQRYKRDDYNKQAELETKKKDRQIKTETADFLKKQMAERDAARKLEHFMEDDSFEKKANIQRTNDKILTYCDQVIDECKALNKSDPNGPERPLFPILKVIQQFKKENSLLPPKTIEESAPPKKERQLVIKRPVCPKPLRPEEIYYL